MAEETPGRGDELYGEEFAFTLALNRVVEDGDSFESAARAFGLDVEELRAAYAKDRRVLERAAIEGMARVEEADAHLKQPNPKGRYPLCKPKLFNIEVCERCENWIKGVSGPCPAVPPDKRWGEDCAEGEG
jgi:hypothetical protein